MPRRAKFRSHDFQISCLQHHLMYLFLKSIICDNWPPLFVIIRLCPLIYTYSPFNSGKLTWPQNILEVSSDYYPHCLGGRWSHEIRVLASKHFHYFSLMEFLYFFVNLFSFPYLENVTFNIKYSREGTR